MPNSVALTLRILLAACLLGFLAYAFYSLWKQLRYPFPESGSSRDLSIHIILGAQLLTADQAASVSSQGNAGSSGDSFPARSLPEASFGLRLVFRANTWWVEGVEPMRSMLLNGAPLMGPAQLRSGDELRVNPPVAPFEL